MEQIIKETAKYVKNVLGINIRTESFNRTEKLPLFIKSMYALYKADMPGRQILFVIPVTEDYASPLQIKKHEEIIGKAFSLPVVFILRFLESYNRKRLVNQKISFIVPGKQMYMPQLLIDLRESFHIIKQKKNFFSPATQLLMLYHLQKEALDGKKIDELAHILEYTPMSMSRAVDQMTGAGLCETKKGRSRAIFFNDKPAALWEKALPFLRPPVYKIYYLKSDPEWPKLLFKANLSALAVYTDLAAPSRLYYAGYGSTVQRLMLNKKIIKFPEDEECPLIEEWDYDPSLLQRNNCVDPLSLYLSLMETGDERIDLALKSLIHKELKW